ncbi:hypothetical protein GCM10011494_31010 [Novosphingobium endophyticum]|uniref:Lipoprotein n=1 Tax=Novosphingobium endophyticum TaxID=1955250 RepID=A0A916X6L7_9SPHN|nr:hypothetical protein [Novosphingobium endophyticum]GGC10148.1 hypothetical protein GCM10011494_31010 [Novosphingobium endophyticum]
MKANPRLRPAPLPILALPLAAGAMLLASCVPQVSEPPPRQAPTPATAPVPAPAPVAKPAADWRDAPITPGDWQWGVTGLVSTANFAAGQFIMRCAREQGAVSLMRSGSASAPVTITIRTESGARALTAVPVAGGMAVSVPARDPLLDAIALSRGRFAVEAAGTPPLYIPSWTEISRVIEDCR